MSLSIPKKQLQGFKREENGSIVTTVSSATKDGVFLASADGQEIIAVIGNKAGYKVGDQLVFGEDGNLVSHNPASKVGKAKSPRTGCKNDMVGCLY